MSALGAGKSMFGPLKFPEIPRTSSSFCFSNDDPITCMLCESTFVSSKDDNAFLTHLFKEHKLVIADVDKIVCLKSYVDYWRTRFSLKPIQYFCTTMCCATKSGGNISNEQYFLLSDVVQEDKLLREGLQKKRLDWVLMQQAKERETPVSRSCIFCRLHFQNSRSEYFNHLYEKHNLHLGSPENLVFTDELLDIIEDKMERLQCLFCEGLFKERNVLKEHMRKKQHKRINPDNTTYDRFYVVNYLEMGKRWQQVQQETDEGDQVEDSSDWSDWEDVDQVEPSVVCLFCDEATCNFEEMLTHMHSVHDFNYQHSCQSLGLNFYQQVKLVNYIRLQMFMLHCTKCDQSFSSKEELLQHMTAEQHFEVPPIKLWDQPEFYFPTYENDSFLCHLDDSKDDVDEQICDSMENVEVQDVAERRENLAVDSLKGESKK